MTESLETLGRTFWEQGYLVLEDFFAEALMDRMDATIVDHFGADPSFRHETEFLSKAQTEVIPWFPQNPDLPDYTIAAAAAFNELETDPRLAALSRNILGADWQRQYCMVMFSKQGTRGQAWHQDCPPDHPAQHNLNRLVYTRDITDEIGGQTVVMPGSHRKGLLPAGEPHEDLPGEVVLRPRKGTLVMLHGHTWHRVLPVMGAFRFSTNYRAAPQGTPEHITDICVYRNLRYQFSTSKVLEERLA